MFGFEAAYSQLAALDAMSERQIKRLFTHMPGGDRIKTTRAGRFEDLDRLLAAEIKSHFPSGAIIRVHDLAASNAITSAELFRLLSATQNVEVKGSDYYDAVYRVRLFGLDFIFDAENAPVQLAAGRLALATRRGWRLSLTAPLWRAARRKLQSADRISLFHPLAEQLASTDPRFTLAREDIFHPAPEKFEVIRMLNTIWPPFAEPETSRAMSAVTATLVDGGLFVFGRKGDYSIFLKAGERFTEIATIGDKTENLWLVNALAAARPAA